MQFKAIVVNKDEQGYRASQENMDGEQLRQMGEVLVAVEYSTINYKDALAITGKAPVVRSFPMVLGIDFCGKVVESSSQQYEPGDAVLLNGWGVGEKHWGGLAQRACVDADWLIPLPDGLTPVRPWPLERPVIRPCCACLPLRITASRLAARSW